MSVSLLDYGVMAFFPILRNKASRIQFPEMTDLESPELKTLKKVMEKWAVKLGVFERLKGLYVST